MEEKHTKAIELKYLGKTYAEIAQEVELTENTLKEYFSKDGMLYTAYMIYAGEQNDQLRAMARHLISKELVNATKILFKQLEVAQKAEDSKSVIRIIELLFEYGGMESSKNRDPKKPGDKAASYEQFLNELDKRGIDPTTGLRKRALEVVQDQSM